jgi:hypothetical protein
MQRRQYMIDRLALLAGFPNTTLFAALWRVLSSLTLAETTRQQVETSRSNDFLKSSSAVLRCLTKETK